MKKGIQVALASLSVATAAQASVGADQCRGIFENEFPRLTFEIIIVLELEKMEPGSAIGDSALAGAAMIQSALDRGEHTILLGLPFEKSQKYCSEKDYYGFGKMVGSAIMTVILYGVINSN